MHLWNFDGLQTIMKKYYLSGSGMTKYKYMGLKNKQTTNKQAHICLVTKVEKCISINVFVHSHIISM